jgi:hypothetical protein
MRLHCSGHFSLRFLRFLLLAIHFDRVFPCVRKRGEDVEPGNIQKAQLISCLKPGGYPTGLLINFHVEHRRDSIHRLYPSK